MSLSPNFPHKIALLQVALRAGMLKINTHLKDAAELAVISSLLVFLDSKDFRLPITKPRKTIGQFSMLGRTALYAKLAALEERQLIEREGDRAIRFTEFGASLLTDKASPEAKNHAEKKPSSFFRVGNASLPKEVVPLLTRGLSAKQVIALMAEAKKAKVKIQDQVKQFGTILDKYEGKSLFLVFRSFLKNPGKYESKPAAPAAPKQTFSDSQRRYLAKLSNNDKSILRPSERVTYRDGVWEWSSPDIHGGAPQPITTDTLKVLSDRIRQVCEKAQAEFGAIRIQQVSGDVIWHGDTDGAAPIVTWEHEPSIRLVSNWGTVYASLPSSCWCWTYLFGEEKADSREGHSFIRKGIQYVVDVIDAGRALLRFERASRWVTTWVTTDQLADASIQWL